MRFFYKNTWAVLLVVLFMLPACKGSKAESSLTSDNQVNESVLQECPRDTTVSDITLTNSNGKKTAFKIPRSYFNRYYKPEGENFISLVMALDGMRPICRHKDYQTNDSQKYSQVALALRIDPSIPEGFLNSFSRVSKSEYTEFVKKEREFNIYHSTKDYFRRKELLVPEDHSLAKPTFILCGPPGKTFANASGLAGCTVTQQHTPYLRIQYSFDASHLGNIKAIEKNVDQFLDSLIVKN